MSDAMRVFDVKRVRDDFPILGRTVYGRPLVYLDNAATAQKPRRVMEAMDDLMTRGNGNVHRGAHLLSEESTAAYEAARETVRAFIGAAHREEVIFTSGATAGLNVAARGLCNLLVGEGDNVIVSEMEHHSNLVPWQLSCSGELRPLPFEPDGTMNLDALEEIIDNCTRVVALTQCSNVLGTRPDIRRAAEIAHRHGAVLVVDGCQGAVHGGVDVREAGCDMYAFSGHKLYGPTGIGVLYGRRELLNSMAPFMGGGDMVERVTMARSTWAPLPFKFEAGTSNYVGAVGMAEAMRYLGQFDPAEVERHERELLKAATEGLLQIEGLTVYGTAPGKAALVSFNVEGVHSLDLGMVLDRQGVAIRTGSHCAQPLLARYGVETTCRASMAMYNTVDEVDALVAAVRKGVAMLRR
jgi:cysteine desulfurase/selenocysteine lyase